MTPAKKPSVPPRSAPPRSMPPATEESEVRYGNGARSERPSAPGSSGLSRDARMVLKAAEAERLLASKPPNDGRVRLLQAALLRGDEALLDAILETLPPDAG